MDPITLAILAAITSGITSAATSVVQESIKDSYNYLKSTLQKKLGEQSEVIKAINDVEEKPSSEGRKVSLSEEIIASQIDKDTEVIAIAQKLLELLSKQNPSSDNTQFASGKFITQANQNSTAYINVNSSNKKQRKKK